jgi:protein gp37
MAENSSIEWCDHTFNPWEGCQKVGPGCDNCYAEARDIRFTGGTHWGPGAPRRLTSDANWRKPLVWNAQALKSGIRPRVFCASLADVFDNAVDPAWRARLWELVWMTPHLDWLLLTKRPGNISDMLPTATFVHPAWRGGWRNVWLGCTVVNQAEADRDIPNLLAVPAKVRFLSMEPLLGPVDLFQWMGVHHSRDNNMADPETRDAINKMILLAREQFRAEHGNHGLSWIITGGESGKNARPAHPDWFRSLRDQCAAAGVAFHFKQFGEWMPFSQFADDGDWMYHPLPDPETDESRRCKYDSVCIAPDSSTFSTGTANQYHRIADGAFAGPGHMNCFKIGKARAGRLLDGVEHNGFPVARP